MQPDLSAALSQPGVPDAFDKVVDLMADGVARDDAETMARAGYAFGHLVELVGGHRMALLALIRTAAMSKVRAEGGLNVDG